MVKLTPWRKAHATGDASAASTHEKETRQPRKWNLGILSDPQTDEVPGKKP